MNRLASCDGGCRAAALALALALAAAGCASPPRPAPAAASTEGDVVVANRNLVVQGIPPIPRRIADDVARYTEFRGHAFVDWHPTRREMLVAFRKDGGDTTQLFRLASPLGALEPLTDFAEPVREGRYEPIGGEAIVFERATGGDEASQLFRLDLATRQVAPFAEPGLRHDLGPFLHGANRLLYTSRPLDRTASGGSREQVTTRLTLVEPARPATRRVLAELPGGGWGVGGVSWDDRTVALGRYVSAGESEVWLLDLASGERRQILPAPAPATAAAPARAAHLPVGWKRDGSALFVVTDRAGEFLELAAWNVADAALVPITRQLKADVVGVSQSADARLLAVVLNVAGRHELRLFDAASYHELPTPAIGEGSVAAARFHRHLPLLALATTGSKAPSQLAVLVPADGTLATWTRPLAAPGIDMAAFREQRVVRWPSFDGREISGLLSLPPARFAGRRPVLIDIHGGPEAQAKVGFLGRLNYVVEELGVAVLRPNVRGSAGFGKTFMTLDDGLKREDAVQDIGALLDWIARQPELDASRVVVQGGSYGGYMSLAVATTYADRIAGAIDVVGISDFATFLQNTESYRRDLRRAEYGDERDPRMRAFFERISPLRQAARITKPLLVVHGRNDPRVPYTEAEQIVAGARGGGGRVWYLRAENEGHGFARKENADYLFYATVMFLRDTLLR